MELCSEFSPRPPAGLFAQLRATREPLSPEPGLELRSRAVSAPARCGGRGGAVSASSLLSALSGAHLGRGGAQNKVGVPAAVSRALSATCSWCVPWRTACALGLGRGPAQEEDWGLGAAGDTRGLLGSLLLCAASFPLPPRWLQRPVHLSLRAQTPLGPGTPAAHLCPSRSPPSASTPRGFSGPCRALGVRAGGCAGPCGRWAACSSFRASLARTLAPGVRAGVSAWRWGCPPPPGLVAVCTCPWPEPPSSPRPVVLSDSGESFAPRTLASGRCLVQMPPRPRAEGLPVTRWRLCAPTSLAAVALRVLGEAGAQPTPGACFSPAVAPPGVALGPHSAVPAALLCGLAPRSRLEVVSAFPP